MVCALDMVGVVCDAGVEIVPVTKGESVDVVQARVGALCVVSVRIVGVDRLVYGQSPWDRHNCPSPVAIIVWSRSFVRSAHRVECVQAMGPIVFAVEGRTAPAIKAGIAAVELERVAVPSAACAERVVPVQGRLVLQLLLLVLPVDPVILDHFVGVEGIQMALVIAVGMGIVEAVVDSVGQARIGLVVEALQPTRRIACPMCPMIKLFGIKMRC